MVNAVLEKAGMDVYTAIEVVSFQYFYFCDFLVLLPTPVGVWCV